MKRFLAAALAAALVLAWPASARQTPTVQVYTGTFAGATATGDQTISGIVDQDGNSFTPEFVWIFGTQQTAAATTDEHYWVLGLTDCTNQRSSWGGVQDNAATSNANQTANNARLIDTYDATTPATNHSRATIVSCGSGQVVINWSVAGAGTAFLYHLVAIGGSSYQAHVQTFQPEVNPSDDTATFIASTGWFFPAAVLSNTSNAFLATQSMGWWARQDGNVVQQHSFWTCSEDNQAATDARALQFSTVAASQAAGTCVAGSQQYSMRGNHGMLAVTGNNEWIWNVLHGGGVTAFAGEDDAPTSNGTQAITGVGCAPVLAVFGSIGRATTGSVLGEGHFSLGVATEDAQGQIWTADTHTADPTVNARMFNTSTVITTGAANATGSSSSVTSQASLQSFDADGFTLNWTTTDATAREFVWHVLCEPAAVSTGGAGVF